MTDSWWRLGVVMGREGQGDHVCETACEQSKGTSAAPVGRQLRPLAAEVPHGRHCGQYFPALGQGFQRRERGEHTPTGNEASRPDPCLQQLGSDPVPAGCRPLGRGEVCLTPSSSPTPCWSGDTGHMQSV